VVAIMTPNASHHPIAQRRLERASRICDQAAHNRLDDAPISCASRDAPASSSRHYILHTTEVRQAREMIRSGELGAIRLVMVEHASGWASTR